MKVLLTLALVAAVVVAEPPSNRQQQQQQYFFARQQDASSGPYAPRGWKPDGPVFSLPERQQAAPQGQLGAQQQYAPPQQQYGAPQQQYGAPPQSQYGAPDDQGPSPRQQQVPSTFRNSQFARQQQQGYGGPAPQQGYGGPSPQQGYGAASRQQQQQQQGYPGTQPQPQTSYGSPQFRQQPGQSDYPTTTEYPNATEIDEPITETEPETEQVRSATELEDEEGDIDEPRNNQQRSGQQQQQQERGEYYVALPDGRLQRVRYVSRQDLEAMAYFAKIRAEDVEPLRGPIYAYAPLQKLEVTPGSLQVQSIAPVVPLGQNGLTLQAETRPQKLVASAPKIEIKPLAQVQYQLDNPAKVVPLSSSYTTVTTNYGASAQIAPVDDRFILAINP